MARRRFFVPREFIGGSEALLPPAESHHLRHVLRLGAGTEVEILDGTGRSYLGTIALEGASVKVTHLTPSPATQPAGHLILAAGLIKADKFEWILQKGTELGVHEFVPLITRFAVVKIPETRIESRLQRWGRIVAEASKQCRRVSIPRVRAPLAFEEFMGDGDLAGLTRILLYEKDGENLGRSVFTDRLVLCVGPEGGWDPGEVLLAREAGFRIVSLGPRILRAETAAIAATAIVQFRISGALV